MMTYDPIDKYVVLFGGLNNTTHSESNQTWTYSAGKWTQLHPKRSPPHDALGAMTYDAKDRYVLLFGGDDQSQILWRFLHGQWSKFPVHTKRPSPRDSPSMAYDVKDGYVVLFGGVTFGYQVCGCGAVFLDDTWTFVNGTWTDASHMRHGRPTGPTGGFQAMLVYDQSSASVLEFDGLGYGGGNATTWSFSAGNWTALYPKVSPPPRYEAASAWDSALGAAVLFGGYSFNGSSVFNDTWEYAGGSWSQVNTTHAPQFAPWGWYSSVATAYDPSDHYLLLFGGGSTTAGPSNETWTYG